MPTLSEDAEEGVLVTWFVVPGAVGARGRAGRRGPGGEGERGGLRPRGRARWPRSSSHPGRWCARGRRSRCWRSGPRPPRSARRGGAPRAAVARALLAAVSPSARRLARELGRRPVGVAGSGPGGRIVEADVRAAAEPGSRRGAGRWARRRRAALADAPHHRDPAHRGPARGRSVHADRRGRRDGAGGGARPARRRSGAAGRATRRRSCAPARSPSATTRGSRSRWSEDGLVPPAVDRHRRGGLGGGRARSCP